MTDEEIIEKIKSSWNCLSNIYQFAEHNTNIFYNRLDLLQSRLKNLRETEWKYKELCK